MDEERKDGGKKGRTDSRQTDSVFSVSKQTHCDSSVLSDRVDALWGFWDGGSQGECSGVTAEGEM